jgi:hypothetical protein
LAELWPNWTGTQPPSPIQKKALQTVQSTVLISSPSGYNEVPLPIEIQTGPIRDWVVLESTNASNEPEMHILSVGNFPFWRPSLGAPQLGNPVSHLTWDSTQQRFTLVPPSKSGVTLQGAYSTIVPISISGTSYILLGTHDGQPRLYQWTQ